MNFCRLLAVAALLTAGLAHAQQAAECSWDRLAPVLGLKTDDRYLYLQPDRTAALQINACTLGGIKLSIRVQPDWTFVFVNSVRVAGPVRLDRRVHDASVFFAAGSIPPPPPPAPGILDIPDRPGLPRVLLIGDSVSMGYTQAVRERLKDKANVHRPDANCGSTIVGLRDLDKWLGAGHWDAIHFNFGLHDLGYVFPNGANQDADGNYAIPANGKPRISLAQYEDNLHRIVARLKPTGARLVWASTTPVPADLHSYVRAAEIPYNQVATRVMREEGVAIDDLWEFSTPMLDHIQIPGNPHFTTEGYRVLSIPTAQSIERALRGYQLLYEDTFQGGAVNESDWRYRLDHRTGGNIDGFNLRQNVSVSGGELHIAVKQETIDGKLENTGGGLIGKHQFGYGYYESLSRPFMAGRGVHSSFWQAGGAQPNNDIFEIDSYEIDSKSGMGCNNLYLHISPKDHSVPWPSRANVPFQLLPGGWFLDSYEYTPDGVIFYDNGQVVSHADWKDLTAAQVILLTGLNGVGKVDADKLPGETTFRYFRYYAKDYPGVNLLPNGSFEYNQDRIDPARPVAWQQEGTAGAGRVVEGGASRDRYKLRHGLPDSASEINTHQTLEYILNGDYELSAMIRSSGGQSLARIRAYDFGGKKISIDIPGSEQWTRVAIPHIAVANHTVTIAIASKSAAGQWLEVDDIQFRKPGPPRPAEPFTLIGDPIWTQALTEPIRFTGDEKFYFFDRSVGLGDAITVSFVMNPAEQATMSPIARIPKTGHSGWAVQLTQAGGIVFRIGGGSDHHDVFAPAAYAEGRESHITCVFDRGTARIFVDGRLLKTETGITQDTKDTIAPGRLGATGDTFLAVGDVIQRNEAPVTKTRNYTGTIREVRVYNRALPESEISKLP